jgi:hypothetical protein
VAQPDAPSSPMCHCLRMALALERTRLVTSGRRRRLIVAAVALLVLAMLAGAGVVAFRAYYRVDLFDSYRAGYVSVVPATRNDGGDGGAACRAAVAAAFPSAYPLIPWPEQVTAFWVGCNTRRAGYPADPWEVHSSLSQAD